MVGVPDVEGCVVAKEYWNGNGVAMPESERSFADDRFGLAHLSSKPRCRKLL